jgi:hypothetical protein
MLSTKMPFLIEGEFNKSVHFSFTSSASSPSFASPCSSRPLSCFLHIARRTIAVLASRPCRPKVPVGVGTGIDRNLPARCLAGLPAETGHTGNSGHRAPAGRRDVPSNAQRQLASLSRTIAKCLPASFLEGHSRTAARQHSARSCLVPRLRKSQFKSKRGDI